MKRTTPQGRYDKKNTTRVALKLNINTDSDILDRLNDEPNKQGYIKKLIREDIETTA